MKTFGFSWPPNLECSQYPPDSDMCVPGKNHTGFMGVGSAWNISNPIYTMHSGTHNNPTLKPGTTSGSKCFCVLYLIFECIIHHHDL